MPTMKRGKKRTAPSAPPPSDQSTDGEIPLAPPNRETWPGWVEIESEPALFNGMLKDMGVRGIKLQEVYALDDEMIAILPRPIHALIFLFRYREVDQTKQNQENACPDDVWFANQIPDFACASVALLNIVNNIDRLEMGSELQNFRDFTKSMDPLSRGDAIDSFDFVKRIHNSFARENDLLNADMYVKQKSAASRKRQAYAKAKATREAKRIGKIPLKEMSSNVIATPTRTSTRKRSPADRLPAFGLSNGSSPLSSPPESDADFRTPSKSAKESPSQEAVTQRRSGRKSQPRKDTFAASAMAAAEVEDEEGFHFIAYMPINGRVWKMDGLDSHPESMSEMEPESGDDWLGNIRPTLETRMAMYEGASIQFNLMAVVHDPAPQDRRHLLENIRELQLLDAKLDKASKDWRSWKGAETPSHTLMAATSDLQVSESDLAGAVLLHERLERIGMLDDPLRLLALRQQVVAAQRPLAIAVRDALQGSRDDDEKVRHCRHDYGSFVREWLGALVDQELSSSLVQET